MGFGVYCERASIMFQEQKHTCGRSIYKLLYKQMKELPLSLKPYFVSRLYVTYGNIYKGIIVPIITISI